MSYSLTFSRQNKIYSCLYLAEIFGIPSEILFPTTGWRGGDQTPDQSGLGRRRGRRSLGDGGALGPGGPPAGAGARVRPSRPPPDRLQH